MATTTPNFGWPVPTSTDYVKNGATAIEGLGDAIDASLVYLKGGTTGQVLSKTSNTDMAFTWVTQDDANAIQNTIVDAKGDLIGATANDTPTRIAVGTDGQVLTADSASAAGVKWATAAAGGAFTTLASGNLSGSSLSLTSISGSYQNLYLIIYNARTTSTDCRLQFRINNITTGGSYKTQFFTTVGVSSQSYIDPTNGATNIGPYNNGYSHFILSFRDYSSTTGNKMGTFQCIADPSNIASLDAGVWYQNTQATSAITRIDTLFSNTDTFAGGTYLLLGEK